MSGPNEEHDSGYPAQPTADEAGLKRVDLYWPALEDDDPEDLERLAEDLKAAVTGDYPDTMADGYQDNPEPEPEERFVVVPVRMTYDEAAALLARERGTDQLDVYDEAMAFAVLAEAGQRAIRRDLATLNAQDQWKLHLVCLSKEEAGS